MKVGIQAARMTGAEFKNQPLLLRFYTAKQIYTKKDIVDRMASSVKMLSVQKARQVFLDASKMLGETLSECTPSFADEDGYAEPWTKPDVWKGKAFMMTMEDRGPWRLVSVEIW